MKKIGILTTHRANNFGAVLQAHSLVATCRELGADAEIIDWRTPSFEDLYHKFHFARHPRSLLKNLIFQFWTEAPARHMFCAFRNQIPMSRPYGHKNLLYEANGIYDAFVVGSDQVWNPRQTAPTAPEKFDRTYLLDFVRSKQKYSYAASIGNRTIEPSSLIDEYRKAWKDFVSISMRERSGTEFVISATHRNDVLTVVDPVFLHDASYWRGLKSAFKIPDQPYVLIYDVRNSDYIFSQASRYAASIKACIVNLVVPGLVTSLKRCRNVSCGPIEFLKLIDSASAIFTNSFHASAFSLIFNRPLFVHFVENTLTTNERFANLADLVGWNVRNYDEVTDESVKEIASTNMMMMKEHIDRSRNFIKGIVQ